ncbi:MAG: hypothetical protein QM796_21265 [Chthoniobacteraceae bacterium]
MPIEIIRQPLPKHQIAARRVELRVERGTLEKRRWRGVAADEREFGFDLDKAMHDGAAFFESPEAVYVLVQLPEPVIEINIAEADAPRAAQLGWLMGNLHFPIQVTPTVIRIADDPAVHQALKREHLRYREAIEVFHPLRGGHHH